MKLLSPHTLLDPSGKLVPLVLVVYKFDGVAEHAVLTRPHSNAKTNLTDEQRKAWRTCWKWSWNTAAQTTPLTKYLWNAEVSYHLKVLVSCLEEGPKLTIWKKRMQQEQLVASIGAKAPTSSGYGTQDMLYVVMEQCKNTEKSDIFVPRCCVCTRAYGCPK